jgi:hypothetical protein
MSLSVISRGLLALTRRKESGGQPGERNEKNVLFWICLKITTDEVKHIYWIKFFFVKINPGIISLNEIKSL